MTDIMKLDLYELLSVHYDSTEQEIKSSYRRLALGCHPDKNPDNPKAEELFRQLSKALEILTDSTAKLAYDRVLKARKASRLRHKKLDQKRQKLKDELEAREKAAKDDVMSEAEATDRLQREIERLRKEGSKQLETENQILKEEIRKEMKRNVELNSKKCDSLPKIKVIKKSKVFLFNSENLEQFFSRFGKINFLVLSKNNSKALIEFNSYEHSLNVYKSRQQLEDLFTIEWIGDNKPTDDSKGPEIDLTTNKNRNDTNVGNVDQMPGFSSDYESVVLMNMRKAEERKQLIRQLKEQETD